MSSSTAGTAPAPEAPVFSHRQIMAILSGLLLGMFLGALDQTIVSTAIRTIADDLDGFSLQAWATTAFLITSTISTPLYGKLSDMYGRRKFFIAAILIFIIGSALCGISTSMYELAGFRALQGLGAGGLMSLALTIIGDIVPPRERAKYQAYFMMVFGTSSVLGPVAGGFFSGLDSLLGLAGWRWIFWLNVPIGIFALFVVSKNLHLPKRSSHHRIDWPGALTLITTLVPLLIVAEQGREWGWDDTKSIACYVIGAVGLVGFILAERAYGDEALLPLRMFRGRTFVVGSLGSFILGMGMFGVFAVLPQYLQVVKDLSPTRGGLAMLPVVVGIMSGSMFSGRFIARTGKYKVLPVVGTAFMVIALFFFSRVNADTPIWQTMIIMLVMGWGLGGNMQPVILAVQNAAKRSELGVATSSVTFFRQMGGTLGTAVFLSILFSTLGDKVSSSYESAGRTPEFGQALQTWGGNLQSTLARATDDTSVLKELPSVLAHPFKVGFTESTSTIYLVATFVMLAGLVTMLFLPSLPLKGPGAPAAQAPEGTDGTTAGTAVAAAAAPAEAAGAPLVGSGGGSGTGVATVDPVNGSMAPGELAERLRSGVQQAKAAQQAMADLALEAERREAAFDAAVENLRDLGLDEASIEAALGEDAAAPRGRHAGAADAADAPDEARVGEELGAQN
ncbi:MDR family MFS transporter [Kineococcus sp. NPDC059986]|uniref:MDR family MFS transporter n=1 Tax=Kineococcus sp. NPDC059986 TaxID=3155538 RepID=UPI0034508F6F